MYPDLFRELCGYSPRYLPAELRHFSVRSLNEREYPGLIRRVGGRATGLLIANVSDETLDQLITYEGEEYELIEVSVRSEDDQVYAAKTFTIKEEFMYLVMTNGWRPDFSRMG